MVSVDGFEPPLTSSQNWWATATRNGEKGRQKLVATHTECSRILHSALYG